MTDENKLSPFTREYYNENYYKSSNYSDYLLRQNRYEIIAKDVTTLLKLKEKAMILDFGCAVGHLLVGLKTLGYISSVGYDISTWAINQCKSKNIKCTNSIIECMSNEYDLTFVLDVFEHMIESDVDDVLSKLKSKYLVVRIPVKLNDDDTSFYLKVSRKDISHINCKSKNQWINKLRGFGFVFEDTIITKELYNSDGCFCAYFRKGL